MLGFLSVWVDNVRGHGFTTLLTLNGRPGWNHLFFVSLALNRFCFLVLFLLHLGISDSHTRLDTTGVFCTGQFSRLVLLSQVFWSEDVDIFYSGLVRPIIRLSST